MKLLRLAAPLVPFLMAAIVVALKLPGDAQYVGTDVGFSFISPAKHVWDITWYAWSWYGPGSINLYNLSVAPFYFFVELFHSARLSAVQISHAMEVLQFGGIGLGAYVLSAGVLGQERARDVVVSLCVALFAMFSYFGAIVLLVPASLYQPAFIAWPCLIAWEMRLLRTRRSPGEIVAFATTVFVVLTLNLAHTVAGSALLVLVAVAGALSSKSWKETLRVVGWVVSTVLVLSLPFWASILVYHAMGGTPLIASANLTQLDSLIDHVRFSHSLSSFTGLLRLNTIVWWPSLDQARPYDNTFVFLTTFALAALAVVGFCNKRFDFFTRRFWGLVFLASLFLAKGIHAPFGDWYANFLGLPLMAMFREANDKFILIVYIATVVLASIGLQSIRSVFPRAFVALALIVAATPFFFGQPFLPGFVVRVPPDYASVKRLLDQDPAARVFSVTPSNLNEQGSTYWFHGSNLDDALFRNPVTYSTTFQAMGLSAAPIYGDDRLVSAQEYFADRQVGRILGIRYVLVHKDFTEGFDMGFSRTQDVHVNGQRIADAVLIQCEKDADLEQLYDGAYLRLYRVRTVDSPLAAFGHLHAVRGYGNALFPLLELSPGNRGFVFSGNQVAAIDQATVAPLAFADRVTTFVTRPAAQLSTDQIVSPPALESRIGSRFDHLPVPLVNVGAMPPGDYAGGIRWAETTALAFPVTAPARAPLGAFYLHRPGYSALESRLANLAAATPPPASSGDIGRESGSIQPILNSPYLASHAFDVDFPIAGAVHAFILISGTRASLSDPATLEITVTGGGRSPSNLWIPIGDWDQLRPLGVRESLAGALGLPTDRAAGILNLDVTAAVVQVAHGDPRTAYLYQPGLRIVGARLWTERTASEGFGRPASASLRMYDVAPDDYRAQGTLASSHVVDGITMTDSTAQGTAAADEPGTLVLWAPSTAKGGVVKATYRYKRWIPGQLVLRGYCLPLASGTFTADVAYEYGGRHFIRTGLPVATIGEREPYGMTPLQLDDPTSWEATEAARWLHFTIDLRPVLPDLRRAVVESVVVNLTMQADSSAQGVFIFGPMSGYADAARGRPLTTLSANGRPLQPRRVRALGSDTTVDFGSIDAKPPQLSVISGPLVGNVPSAVRFGPPLVPNPAIAQGTLLDPTLGSISLDTNGVLELGTMFNQGWVLRRGAPRAAAGPLLELGAWLSTQPVVATHFVGEGFTNAWVVPAGSYTVVFEPQVVRDVCVLVLAAFVPIAIVVMLAWSVVARRRRTVL